MAFKDLTALRALSNSMERNEKKMELSTDNLSRAHMPGEKARKLKESPFLQKLSASGSSAATLQTTNPKHISGPQHNPALKVETVRKADVMGVNGNSITPQQEMETFNQAYTETVEAQTLHGSVIRRFKTLLSAGR